MGSGATHRGEPTRSSQSIHEGHAEKALSLFGECEKVAPRGAAVSQTRKTKAQLIEEIAALQEQVAQLKQERKLRMEAERALRDSEELHRITLDNISDAVFITDETGGFTYICPNVDVIFGYTWQQIAAIGNVRRLLGGGLINHEVLDHEGMITNIERTVYDRQGNTHVVLVNVKRVDIQGGTVLFSCREISARKRLENEILDISTREQLRIGRDLHDNLGQHLTGISLMCKGLETKVRGGNEPTVDEVAGISQLVNEAISQTRTLARGLSPIDSVRGGLTSALRDLEAHIDNLPGVKCELICDEDIEVGGSEVATHLFRITQEAVSNAIRHGGASRLTISVKRVGGETVLTIRDNGTGIQAQPQGNEEGMGLQIMEYRANTIGAKLRIDTASSVGTTVTCTLSATPGSTGDRTP